MHKALFPAYKSTDAVQAANLASPASFARNLADARLEQAKADALKAVAKDVEEYKKACKNYEKAFCENGLNSKEFDFWNNKIAKIQDRIERKIIGVLKNSPYNYDVKEPDWKQFVRDLAHNKTRADKFSDDVDNHRLHGNNAVFVVEGIMQKIMADFPSLFRLDRIN